MKASHQHVSAVMGLITSYSNARTVNRKYHKKQEQQKHGRI